jgi:hypothetical protein
VNSVIDAEEGRRLLEHVGFLHVPGAPFAPPPAYLIVGIRPRPTLEHFDPKWIECWQSVGGRGAPLTVDWMTPNAQETRFSWGRIEVGDRLGVSNQFLAFGGTLEVQRFADLKVCVFSSSAPIVARGGHSQGRDFGSSEVAVFLAKLRGACHPGGALERRVASMSATELYSAFVADGVATIIAGDRRSGWRRADRLVLLRERRRLRATSPSEWVTGSDLACEIGVAARD